MKEVCNVFSGLDYQGLTTDKPSTQVLNIQASLALNHYFGCYDVVASRAIKQQIIDIGIAQLALFKAAKMDIAALTPEMKKATKIFDPKDVTELLSQSASIGNLGDANLYTKRYVRVIKELQTVKTGIWELPYCESMTPAFDMARRALCFVPLRNGMRMFWMLIVVCVGMLILAWAFLNAEIRIKKNMDG